MERENEKEQTNRTRAVVRVIFTCLLPDKVFLLSVVYAFGSG